MSRAPPQPAYILRGHGSSVQATSFMRQNSRLATGDAEGWVVIWDLAIKRPTTVWKAHDGSLLGIRDWAQDKIITHGKDNKLVVWRLREEDEEAMSKILPVETPAEPRKLPWCLYVLNVNTMNFCSFAHVEMSATASSEILIAVPHILTSETVDIFHLPSTARMHTIPASPAFKGGMIMALSIFYHPKTGRLNVISGFESGHTRVWELINAAWQALYSAHPHSQPVLSLAISSDRLSYVTSSADALIARHVIPGSASEIRTEGNDREAGEASACKLINTRHAGQQGLQIRNDCKIFATAGWDGRVRVYAYQTLRELAVLKWHQKGCYTLAFADILMGSSPALIHNFDAHGTFIVANLPSDPNVVEQAPRENQVMQNPSAVRARQERIWKAYHTHWIAVGGKDGQVSLWDIY
ncbi:unnamed protein product [Blumeria hordei]|uniref:ASTRA-associated protein 1 n=2 Tax=Blumeria hordei TaxID=2867405 RepID=A0A383UI35_BLUHO|nr:WD repeat-containing protein/WD repeat protein [Blumeria hordei DH14]SZE99502.1 unnamed protein product [Blumeria hordei]